MNDDLAERAEEVFFAAHEILSAEERQAFVDEACAGDASLLEAVQELLDAQPAFDAFFETDDTGHILAEELAETLLAHRDLLGDSVPWIAPDQEIGEYIGPFRLLKKIGEGGIGNVYLAEQESPVRRKVALKAIKAGMDTRSVIARFEAERQVLAMMEHPNIAHVFDAGETVYGRPFFVMELVDGVRITTYCDEQRFDIRRRLGLFVQVVLAIQHAHQKGIIHRDIKPSNVLITSLDGKPVPKVIDFGIAKATRAQLPGDRTVATLCEPFVGTPVYMSPEQADMAELDVDLRSDIYSLGVLLYELLVGETPFAREQLLENGLYGLRRILSECEPPRPSMKLLDLSDECLKKNVSCRRTEVRRLKAELSGELDWIVMKALEKDRERRYASADALAEDISRYLKNEPVLARPPGKWYLFRKMVRRNRMLYAFIGTVGLTMTAGLGTSLWMFSRERAARTSEARLRIEAEAREKITQAAVLLNRNRFEDAEILVDGCELPVIRPSLEASDVFFRLASWRVLNGEWEKGAGQMLKFARAVQVDKSDLTDETTRHMVCVAPALVVAGDMERYRRFAEDTIRHFSQTDNSMAADHVLKICTVCPVDDAMLVRLKPFADLVKEYVVDAPIDWAWSEHQNSWRILEVALFELRSGHFREAAEWARKSLGRSDATPSRIATSHIVLAMALHHLNRPGEAAGELACGAVLVDARLPEGLSRVGEYGDTKSGFWHDWVTAKILLDEATGLISEPARR